jgi:hypothetical protein
MPTSPTNHVHVLDIHQASIETKITSLAFQGLANREGSRIFYKARFWNWPRSDEFWMDYLANNKGFRFEQVETLSDLVRLYPRVAKGLVVWDPNIEQTKWIALIMAGLDDLLPIPPECIEIYENLPVCEDLRNRFSSEIDAAKWSVKKLIGRCNLKMGYSIDRTWSGITIDALDYAVQQRSFVYSLNHAGKNPAEIELVHEILSRIGPVAPIFGWGEPEDAYCQTISFHDNYVMCAEAPNLSFWTHIPCERTDWTQRARKDPSSFVLNDKHYIAFCTSEGDTPKMAVSVEGGAWLDPNRGKLPINWGMNPLHLDLFPAIMEFYWNTATENDYFIGGASGAGYTYPNCMPNPEAWMKQTGDYFARADMHETDAWMHFSRPVYELYAKVSGIRAFAMPCGPFGCTLLNGGEAVAFFRGNSGLNYFNSSGHPQDLAAQIKRHCCKRTRPSFSVAHLVPDDRRNPTAQGGWNPTLLLEVAEILGDEFKIVTMQELTELAIRALKEGKCPDCSKPGYCEWDGLDYT